MNYCCSIDQEVELSQLSNLLNQYKNYYHSELLPQIDKLDAGKLSEQGYFGQTWMLSGWTDPIIVKFTEDDAHDIYPHSY